MPETGFDKYIRLRKRRQYYIRRWQVKQQLYVSKAKEVGIIVTEEEINNEMKARYGAE